MSTDFARKILNWFDQHGRQDLPWQQNPTPYRVWVSEIMLQQTQVTTVIPYFERFMIRFPDVSELARAEMDQVLHLWTGLGYYARARNLHRAARKVVSEYGGEFPGSIDELEALPGIGRSTAGAIAALAMGLRAPILDGNVKRVLSRCFATAGWPEQSAVRKELWRLAEELTPQQRVADYTQAIMDLGATLCARTQPDCPRCPLNKSCRALAMDAIAEFPGKKPKRDKPVRAVSLLILQNDQDEVLLERRPATGIWGGLFSLPELAETPPQVKEPGWMLHDEAGVRFDPDECESLPTIRHSFTHYHLDISPLIIEKWQLDAGAAESDRWLWYPLNHSKEVGLAAPIKKLLSTLPRHEHED